ncbi:MAG TPA: membrane protein insertion efficiency factor YidD [Parvularcula sp.]|nr:membrane protein insertion efficiency factor YidD [Parvularcula sp.]
MQTSIGAKAALAALWLYKRTLSPAFYIFGARCRHLPTCSDYAAGAFARHGLHRGGWLTLSRLCRCHPFGSHGFDPVPAATPDHGWRLWRYGDWAWRERGARPPEA